MGVWDPRFYQRSPLFWPIAPAAERLARFEGWPSPEDLTRLFEGEPPVRFVAAPPRPRRGLLPADARYDARIALERTVSTRAASWHDLLNALVWTSFPRAKAALHARQHRMIAARLGEDLRLPGARTKEQDAVAMLDEGGVVLLCAEGRRAELARASKTRAGSEVAAWVEQGEASAVTFGHAIYEGAGVRGAAGAGVWGGVCRGGGESVPRGGARERVGRGGSRAEGGCSGGTEPSGGTISGRSRWGTPLARATGNRPPAKHA